jgi:hypothetical protein
VETESQQPVAAQAFQSQLNSLDRVLLTLLQLYGVVAIAFLALAPRFFLPAEDAVILFQYSRNLAEHGAITFLAGGPHTEGATDFAWMLLIAAANRCGVPAFWCSAIFSVLSLIALAAVLLRLAKLRFSVPLVLAIAGSAALFPQIFAAAFGFAILPDALLLAMLVLYVVECRAAAASLAALVLCLFRPDGIVFVVPLLLCLLLAKERRARSMGAICAVFVVPGVLYSLWRWHYFGELFPLPFLVKSDTHRVLGIVVARSVRTSLIFLLFTAIILVPVARLRERRNLHLAIALIAVPTAFYWMMRLDQNVGYRFFYYLPLAAAILLAVNWPALSVQRSLILRTAFAAWLLLFAMPLYRELRTFRDEQFDNVKQISQELGQLPQKGTMITSEAGFLPYFSGWTTYDAWGLNTAEFAHRFFQPSDVSRLNPDLVVLHPDRPESCLVQPDWQSAYAERAWPNMTRNLVIGADLAQYDLWLISYGSDFYRQRMHWRYGEGDRECWFLRKDSPFYAEIAQALERNHGVAPPKARQLEEWHGQLKR